jgi:hypothetical protein
MTENAIQEGVQESTYEEPTMRRLTMTLLPESIVKAHGGLDRWRRFNRVEATIGRSLVW